jgi:AraC-like DNA-binding protein
VAIKLFSHSLDAKTFESIPIYFASGISYILLPIALIIFFPEVLYGINKDPIASPLKEKSELTSEDLAALEALANRITEYLEKEKAYLNPSFELKDLARALEVRPKLISYTCKRLLNKKFTDLRAHLRIEHAKKLLTGRLTETITIDAVGINSGFKSRSTFYEAFKAETGMTPHQYLENLA